MRAGVETAIADATRLGFGEPIAISAETGMQPCKLAYLLLVSSSLLSKTLTAFSTAPRRCCM